MIDQSDREASDAYGPWPWIAGFAIGGALMALMFGFATGMW
jgi:hypothetical protein